MCTSTRPDNRLTPGGASSTAELLPSTQTIGVRPPGAAPMNDEPTTKLFGGKGDGATVKCPKPYLTVIIPGNNETHFFMDRYLPVAPGIHAFAGRQLGMSHQEYAAWVEERNQQICEGHDAYTS